ncbi:hypothetical protein [Stenotrophomonas maltophilia]|uniref:hypothetical protein n=1 Tax=Stenotrophomonas maltophilia TaxID=40324 RepID=UPI0021C74FB3|nr:hypothetical protein [Stenotrophomonas maltophilia]MCU1015528.1 hypothetical protein [Stenotrophomonas maltophilia]
MSLEKICLAAALLALPAAAPVLAKQGEVCSSKPSATNNTLSDSTVSECKTAGAATIPKPYSQGWKVVTTLPQANMGTDPKTGLPQSRFAWTVVVEHD